MPISEILMPHHPFNNVPNAPVICLAGSERTLDNSWHETTTVKLRQNAGNIRKQIYVANPFETDFTNASDKEKEDWRELYTKRAIQNGVYLVWLSSKDVVNDHPSINKALSLKRRNPEMNMVIGAGSSGNSKERLILNKRIIESGLQPPFTSLELTCKAALSLIS